MEETALETPQFVWDLPQEIQRRVKTHLAVNSSLESAERRFHTMTAAEVLELDRQIQGGKGGCGGCGPKVNEPEGETPLEVPVMKW